MKRLIVYCDGTWNDSDKGTGFTNVARLCWATFANDERSTPPMPQIGYYHSGVGTGDLVDKILGGGIGAGLARNVRDAYSFLASNYCDGDEILLFGFSRGAYTARSIAGLIGWAGLLHKHDMDRFAVLWQSYKLRGNPDFVDAREASFADRHRGVKVRCVGVWDTVGALGIPGHLPTHFKQLYEFLDTDLGPHIENAFHAIALDEHRSDFAPTLWTQPKAQAGTQILEQTWFAGAHSNVGGGYDEHGLSDVTLAWMAARVAPLLALDIDQLEAKQDRTFAWGLGGVVDSSHGFWSLLGKIDRQPGRHEQPGATNESLHASVAERLARLVGGYKCPALEHMVGGPLPTSPLPSVELQLRWSGTSPKAPPPAVQIVDIAMRQ